MPRRATPTSAAVLAASEAVVNAARSIAILADALKTCAEARQVRASVGGVGFHQEQEQEQN